MGAGMYTAGLALAIQVLGAGAARRTDLSGTRPGPSGFFMTRAERTALRRRVQQEPWAREFFARKVMPRVRRANPRDHVGNVDNPMFYNAVAYVVTGDKRYARTARHYMMKYVMDWERTYPRPIRQYNFYWYLTPVAFARTYDLIAETLEPADEVRVRTYMKQKLDMARTWNIQVSKGGNPNMTQAARSYYAEWACAIHYDAYLDWLLNAPRPVCTHGGIWANIDHNTRDGGMSTETIGYGLVGACPLVASSCRYPPGRSQARLKK